MNRFRLVRGLLIGLGVLLVVYLLGCLGLRVYGAYRLRTAVDRYQREVGSLSIESFVRPRIPMEQNAVTWLRPGILAVVFFPGDQAVVSKLSGTRSTDWAPDETAKLEAVLERNRPAIEILGRARGMKSSNWEIRYEQATTAKIPDLLAAINAGKLLAARGRLALARGDRETAIVSVETLGAMARSHEAENAMIVFLIGIAIERQQIGLVHELMALPDPTIGELARLEASLSDEELALAYQRTLRSAVAAVVHDARSEEFLRELPRAVPTALSTGAADLVAAFAIDAHLAFGTEGTQPVTAPLVAVSMDDRNVHWWSQIPAFVGPNAANAGARASATSSSRELARIAIALRRGAMTQGHYPSSLPALAGSASIDPLTGGPFAYAVDAAGSAEVRSTTTEAILKSISPVGFIAYDALYRWTLPATNAPPASSPRPTPPR